MVATGFGVAEAMDTAQRGMGLDWPARRGADPPQRRRGARDVGGRDRSPAAGTDQLAARPGASARRDRRGLPRAVDVVETPARAVILMASRRSPPAPAAPTTTCEVYDALLAGVDAPVILHWLGEMFDPALAGYWGVAPISTTPTEDLRRR